MGVASTHRPPASPPASSLPAIQHGNQKATTPHQTLTRKARTQLTLDNSASKGMASLAQSPWTYLRKAFAGNDLGVSIALQHYIPISMQNIQYQAAISSSPDAAWARVARISTQSMENLLSSLPMATPVARPLLSVTVPRTGGLLRLTNHSTKSSPQVTTTQTRADSSNLNHSLLDSDITHPCQVAASLSRIQKTFLAEEDGVDGQEASRFCISFTQSPTQSE